MMDDRTYVPAALEYLDPAVLDYGEWAEVGMALHAEGYGADMWEEWSRRDPARFHPGECARKWQSFGSSPSKVAGGTIVQMARERGWTPPRRPWDDGPDEALDWDAPIIDPSWVEPAELPENPWDPVGEAVRYLEAVFEPEDIVGYVTTAFQGDDGRWKPAGKGAYDRTAGQLIAELERTRSLEDALGTANPEAGAWIRFNPLTGAGVRNADVAEFRHALVESDELEPERQLALMRELELPCSAIVESGGKSVHAIVRVDADDWAEYRRRVDYLYRVCEKHGLAVDTQNKNPSRLSRFPGFERAGKRQRMLEGSCGRASWAEWVEWVEERTDDLPEFENLGSIWDDMPDLTPELIHGVLRQGHKMLVAAGSKAGKSFAMAELCIAIAEGVTWLGFQCSRGRVLYVNLELDRASCLHRFKAIYEAMGRAPSGIGNIDIWNLRGKSMPMRALVPALVRRTLKTRPVAIIIDPIYKVSMGDENRAEDVSKFCAQLDMVAEQVGASVIYVHHHSKGLQGNKQSMDRASGSGVFSRDADAQVDMIELPLDEHAMKALEDRMVGDVCEGFLSSKMGDDWRKDGIVSEDALFAGGDLMISECRRILDARRDGSTIEMLDRVLNDARSEVTNMRGLRVELTLREFASAKPVDIWFKFPIHIADRTGILADIKPEGVNTRRDRGRDRKAANRHESVNRAIGAAVAKCKEKGLKATRANVADFMGIVDGKEVTKDLLTRWTTASQSSWTEWVCDQNAGNTLVKR